MYNVPHNLNEETNNNDSLKCKFERKYYNEGCLEHFFPEYALHSV